MLDLHAVTKWVDQNVARYAERGATLEHLGPAGGSPNDGTYVDVLTPRHLARVTVWESGFCDQDVLDADTGRRVFWEHRELTGTTEMLAALDRFARRVLEGDFEERPAVSPSNT